MKKNIQEQDIKAQKTSDGKVNINGHKYRLEVKKPLVGWMQVNIEELTPVSSGWKVTASKMGVSQTDIVPQDTILVINKNIGQPQIDLGGKQPKRLVKEENMKKVIKLTETDLENLVKKVLKEQEIEEGIFDGVKDLYRGVKGAKRGFGMDYFQNMSKLEHLIKKLKNLDVPNEKVMAELKQLRTKVSSLGMPQQRKSALLSLIDNSLYHFGKYSTINDQILAQIQTLNLDNWK